MSFLTRFKQNNQRVLGMLLGVWLPAAPVLAAELTLSDAEQIAINNDPLVAKFQAEASALMEQAVAVAQLPDPKLRIGTMNVPFSFDVSQEPMTQAAVVGLQQMFPSAGLLDGRREQSLLKAEMARARAMERALAVLRNLRTAWMEVYYQVQAGALVRESEDVFDQLVKITQYQYRAGRGTQQDVMRARLELSLLNDRELKLYQEQEQALAELSRWLGEIEEDMEPSMMFPTMPALPRREELKQRIEVHPSVAVAKANLGAARKGVAIARAKYKPNWSMDVSYGARLGGRADFWSAMVMMDLPFFTGKRQDKTLNARGHEVNAARDGVDEVKRDLTRLLDDEFARWRRLGERLEFYKNDVLPQAAQYSESSRKAYQSRVSDFSELVRARLKELQTNLDALRLRVERAKSHYRLLYLAGEAAS